MHWGVLLYTISLFSLALKQQVSEKLIKFGSACGLSKMCSVYTPHGS